MGHIGGCGSEYDIPHPRAKVKLVTYMVLSICVQVCMYVDMGHPEVLYLVYMYLSSLPYANVI